MTNKYIIQYSLFGSNPRYYDALCQNISFINSNYSDFFAVSIVLGDGVPTEWVNYLNKTSAKIINYDEDLLINVHHDFFRIYTILAGDGLGCFCRDADSFLSKNEIDSMMRFIESDYSFHIIRDHPNHLAPIMAGTFGVKSNGYELVKNALVKNLHKYSYLNTDWRNFKSAVRGDQEILANYIYPLVYKNSYIESNYTIFYNERSLVSKCLIPKTEGPSIGEIDPKYNDYASRDKNDYINGKRKMYLPYWIIRLFGYRYVYRIYWTMSD